jgi:hypothetical protein
MALFEDRFGEEYENDTYHYIETMFGERKGYVSVVFGHNPRMSKPRFADHDFRPEFFKWPEEKIDLVQKVDEALNSEETRHENVEVFICPALRKEPSRRAGTQAQLYWVWADLDHSPTDDQIERINHLGAMTILSGTEGHRHVYLPLTKPVSSVHHKALCIALKETIGAKDSKIAENDLLRLPGTINWKNLEPSRVMIKRKHRRAQTGKFWVNILTSMTNTSWSVFLNRARKLTPSELPDVETVDPPKLKGESKKAFAYQPQADGTRHLAIYKLITTMAEEGYTRDQTHATLYSYPPAISKWGSQWRIKNDVDRTWQKVAKDAPLSPLADEDDGTEQPNLKFHDWGTVVRRVANAPAPQYLFEGIWVEGDYGVLSAPDKSGKSWAMLDAAISCASGTAWMNKWETPNAGPVIICFGEGSERKQIRRARAVAKFKGIEGGEFERLPIHPMFSVPQINDDDHLEELEQKIRQVKPALVIIDPFYLAASGADSSSLVQMGTMLNRVQLVCQRHNAALMLSHHWNKSTTGGDVHSRSSGVGLTAWGRVLISMEMTRSHTEPDTMRSMVDLSLHIKGDEIAEQRVDLKRFVWEDEVGDLGSDMNYLIQLSTEVEAEKAKPLRYAATMEKVSAILEDNQAGLGLNQLFKEVKASMNGRALGRKTLEMALQQLVLHGYVQESPSQGRGSVKPYLPIKPFTREDHVVHVEDQDLIPQQTVSRSSAERTRPSNIPAQRRSASSTRPGERARPRVIDFSNVNSRRRR